jgi:UDPglucose 6-dehydrogenase
MRVAVVGTGRVGLPFAAVVSLHYPTLAIDSNAELVQRINSKAHFDEPGLDDCLAKGNLTASTDFGAVASADVVVICVGSQDDEVGYSASRPLAALKSVATLMVRPHQVLCLMSTVPPSAIATEILPYVKSSGILSRIKGFAYTPVMIALGEAVKNFQHPSYVMIGTDDSGVAEEVKRLWKTIAGSDVPFVRSTVVNVAVAKYALNIALVLKISLMNLTAEFCEHLGGDVDSVAEIFRMDSRIAGPGMFRGGLGFGGTCFPIDVRAFIAESSRAGMPTEFLSAVERLNQWQIERSVNLLRRFGKKRVCILGTAFKPNTGVVVHSQGMEIARKLSATGQDVIVYDPVALPDTRVALGGNVRYANSASEAIHSSDVIFIAVDWSEFRKLPPGTFRPEQIIVDPWRILRDSPPTAQYFAFGIGSQ